MSSFLSIPSRVSDLERRMEIVEMALMSDKSSSTPRKGAGFLYNIEPGYGSSPKKDLRISYITDDSILSAEGIRLSGSLRPKIVNYLEERTGKNYSMVDYESRRANGEHAGDIIFAHLDGHLHELSPQSQSFIKNRSPHDFQLKPIVVVNITSEPHIVIMKWLGEWGMGQTSSFTNPFVVNVSVEALLSGNERAMVPAIKTIADYFISANAAL